MSPDKVYLGNVDGVAFFADVSPLRKIILTTEEGTTATNTIALEPLMLDALLAFINLAKAQGKL